MFLVFVKIGIIQKAVIYKDLKCLFSYNGRSWNGSHLLGRVITAVAMLRDNIFWSSVSMLEVLEHFDATWLILYVNKIVATQQLLKNKMPHKEI